METKIDSFNLIPSDVKPGIWSNLSLFGQVMFKQTSRLNSIEINKFHQDFFKQTNQLVSEFFQKLGKFHYLSNLSMQFFIYDTIKRYTDHQVVIGEPSPDKSHRNKIFVRHQEDSLICYLPGISEIEITFPWNQPLTTNTLKPYKSIIKDNIGIKAVEIIFLNYYPILITLFNSSCFQNSYNSKRFSNYDISHLLDNLKESGADAYLFISRNLLNALNLSDIQLKLIDKIAITLSDAILYKNEIEVMINKDYKGLYVHNDLIEYPSFDGLVDKILIMYKAVEKLEEYISIRTLEHTNKINNNKNSLFSSCSLFVKQSFHIDYQSKINTAQALIQVLKTHDTYYPHLLSEEEIKTLSHTMFGNSEDRLAKITRTYVLEPLKMNLDDFSAENGPSYY